ncbi:MAG: GntR family transcriptional regulator [Trueperaceae bacterium]|nr:MAG: GntR family transcriptional regulator [Trueperaceae bacterium]
MFHGRDPIYVQIADRIRADVVEGTLREGEQVMSTNQYAATYRINPATAAKAFAELVADGVLVKQRGIGMFVSDGARERLLAARRARYFDDVLAPALTEARRIGIDGDELVERVRAALARDDAAASAAPADPVPTEPARTEVGA